MDIGAPRDRRLVDRQAVGGQGSAASVIRRAWSAVAHEAVPPALPRSLNSSCALDNDFDSDFDDNFAPTLARCVICCTRGG
jgi:hypothetical protein